jgi:putative hydrolase of the HAD superfamily
MVVIEVKLLKAALFDAGDTLMHAFCYKRDRFCWQCEQAGLPVPKDPVLRERAAQAVERFWIRRHTHPGLRTPAFWREFYSIGLMALDLSPSKASLVARSVGKIGRTQWLDPEAIPLLTTLRERGYRIGLVSNWNGTLVATCAELGLTPYIDYIGASHIVGIKKPDPRLFHHVLGQLGVAPDHAFHVGDSQGTDVVGAQAAGVTPILLDIFGCEDRPSPYRITTLKEVLPLCDQFLQG